MLLQQLLRRYDDATVRELLQQALRAARSDKLHELHCELAAIALAAALLSFQFAMRWDR